MRITMKVLFNPSRRFFATPSSLLRYMSTAATVDQTEAAPPATETPKKVVRVKRDVLFRKLSAPGSSKGSTFETLNGFFGEGDFTNKYELVSCMLQLRRSGKLNQALEVLFSPLALCNYAFERVLTIVLHF